MDFYESHAHLWNKDLLDEEVRQQAIKNATRVGISKGRKQGILKGRKQGLEQGLKQGLEQGAKQTKIETAKSMLKDKMPVESISKYTGLSIEKINKLEND